MLDDTASRARGRRKLLLLLVLFAAPVVAAYTLYFWAPQGWQPQGRTNQGQLVTPPRPMVELALQDLAGQRVDQGVFADKWTLLMLGPAACGDICQQRLYDTRQVRTALGKNTLRVQRILLLTDQDGAQALQQNLAVEHPDLKLLAAEGGQLAAVIQQFTTPERDPLQNPDDIYLLDPHGNWLMVYRPEDPAKGLLKDLKKLLRLSNIG